MCKVLASLFLFLATVSGETNFTSNGVNVDGCDELQVPQGSPLIVNYELVNGKGAGSRRALFTCKAGYYIDGQAIVDCVNDQWEHTGLPKCVRYCPQPPFLRNGGLEISGWAFDGQEYPNGSIARYTCGEGFRLEPTHSDKRICLNGAWTGSATFCVSQGCQLTDAGVPDGFYVQDTLSTGTLRLRYGCHVGFTLLGSTDRECGEDGSWTPSQPPSCVKLDSGHSEVANSADEEGCPPPPPTLGTVVSRLRGLITANHAAPNSEVELRCEEGLRDAETPCEPSRLRCSGGVWHGRAPVCVEFDGCVALPGIPHGSLVRLSDDGRYRVGSRVVFTCQPGYRLHGQSIYSCESNGCWTPTLLPECLPEFYLPSGWEEYALSPGAALLASLGTALAVMALLLAVCMAVVCRRRRRPPRHASSGGSHAGRRLRWTEDGNNDATIQSAPPAALLPPDPDRVALIAFADGLQVGQSVLPSYEEATRGTNGGAGTGVLYGALHRGRGPHWTALGSGGGGGRRGRRERHAPPPLQDGDTLSHHSLHGCTRQSSSTSHSASLRSCAAMGGSTDTVAAGSDASTAVTLDTVSSHSRDASSLASCSGGAGSSGCSSQTASCRAICGSLASFDTSSVLNTEGVPLLEESELEGAAEARADEEATTPPSTTSSGQAGEVKLRGTSPDALN